MGHAADKEFSAYQSKTSAVILQNIMLREEKEPTWDPRNLRRLTCTRPRPRHLQYGRHLALRQEIEDIPSSCSNHATERRRLTREHWNDLQALPLYVTEPQDAAVESGVATTLVNSIESLGDLSNVRTMAAIVHRYDKIRGIIAKEMKSGIPQDLGPSPLMRALIELSKLPSEQEHIYYRNEAPQVIYTGDPVCRFCKCNLTERLPYLVVCMHSLIPDAE